MEEKLDQNDSDKSGDIISESSTDIESSINAGVGGDNKLDIEDQESADSNKLKQIKELCVRTDLSAIAKVDKILLIIDPEPEKREGPQYQKRPLEDQNITNNPKQFKGAQDNEVNEDSGGDVDLDNCVVCGLSLKVFKEDCMKEVHHYLRYVFYIIYYIFLTKLKRNFSVMGSESSKNLKS